MPPSSIPKVNGVSSIEDSLVQICKSKAIQVLTLLKEAQMVLFIGTCIRLESKPYVKMEFADKCSAKMGSVGKRLKSSLKET